MTAVHVALDDLEGAVVTLDAELPSWLASLPELSDVAVMLADLRGLRQRLHTIEQFAERSLAERMEGKELVADGLRVLRRRVADKTVWDSHRLSVELLDRAFADDNGEALPTDAALSRLRWLLFGDGEDLGFKGVANVSYWRVGNLEKFGINGHDFRTVTPGRWVVEVETGDAS